MCRIVIIAATWLRTRKWTKSGLAGSIAETPLNLPKNEFQNKVTTKKSRSNYATLFSSDGHRVEIRDYLSFPFIVSLYEVVIVKCDRMEEST